MKTIITLVLAAATAACATAFFTAATAEALQYDQNLVEDTEVVKGNCPTGNSAVFYRLQSDWYMLGNGTHITFENEDGTREIHLEFETADGKAPRYEMAAGSRGPFGIFPTLWKNRTYEISIWCTGAGGPFEIRFPAAIKRVWFDRTENYHPPGADFSPAPRPSPCASE